MAQKPKDQEVIGQVGTTFLEAFWRGLMSKARISAVAFGKLAFFQL